MRFVRVGVLFAALCATAASAAGASGERTFEDIYGPSGESFRASLGFRVYEAGTESGQAGTSYGVGVDDMLVQWREYKLVEDATDCATSGACASVVTNAGVLYGADVVLVVRVLDSSPYGAAAPADRNDCDGNGSYTDPGDDTDCDDDGAGDVPVLAFSEIQPAGQRFVANWIEPGVYEVKIPASTTATATGVVRVQDAADGAPEVTVRYEDRWDGSAGGNRCRNSADPAEQGFIESAVDVVLVTGDVSVVSYRIQEVSGDLDGYPDTNETVDLFLTLKNRTTIPLTNVEVRASTTDSKIDCLLNPAIRFPILDPKGSPGAIRESPTAIRLHVSPAADRTGSLSSSYAAHLDVAIAADQIDLTSAPQTIDLELDLNSTAPATTTTTFVEGFETGFGSFTFQNLDVNIASNSASNGARCQYSDPDYPANDTYGETQCYLGFAAGQNPLNDWHVHAPTAPDGGRAYLGTRSLHYGKHTPGNPGLDTYGLSQMDAIRTTADLNLAARICRDDPAANRRACNTAADCVPAGGGPCVSASPVLSFKHQIALFDRHFGEPVRQQFDRGVVAVLVAGSTTWRKVYPYENVYDVQPEWGSVLPGCTFDPTDDGNTEDDYFDPGDPARRFGPSSTCFPEFVFGYLGDTDAAFKPSEIGAASDGPGLQGALGLGTWVESKVDLSAYRGRSIGLRFLLTSVKIPEFTDWREPFPHFSPDPRDDGWYVDDVRVTNTLGAQTPSVGYDSALNAALPSCGVEVCSSVTATLGLTPPSGAVPNRAVVLDASGSVADHCLDGALLFRFYEDADGSGTFSAGDLELRPFGTSPLQVEAPQTTTRYGVTVRCSEGGTGNCAGADATSTYNLSCVPPPEVYDPERWWAQGVAWNSRTALSIPPFGEVVDVVRGDLGTLRSTGTFTGSSPLCRFDDSAASSFPAAENPASGQGFYFVLRGQAGCNELQSYRTFHPRENPQNPAKRDTEILVCPP